MRANRESFDLGGVRFYQQFRKCGSCDRCTNGSSFLGHGPYWYQRDKAMGKVTYIGARLPADVERVRAVFDESLELIDSQLNDYDARQRALRALRNCERLDEVQLLLIRSLGLGDCVLG